MKKKVLSLALVLTLLVGLLPFITVYADEPVFKGKLTIVKQRLASDQNRPADSVEVGENNEVASTPGTTPIGPIEGVGFKVTMIKKFVVKNNIVTEIQDPAGSEGDEKVHFTDNQGQIVLENLAAGRYTIQELALNEYAGKQKQAPKGITPNTQVYTVELPYYDVNGNPKTELTMQPKNVSDSAKIILKKVLVADPEQNTEAAQSDVKFKHYRVVPATAPGAQPTYEAVTNYPATGVAIDADALKTGPDGNLTIEHLLEGEQYLLVEETPAGTQAVEAGKVFTATKGFTYEDQLHKFVNTKITKQVSPSLEGEGYTKEETIVPVLTPYKYKIVGRMPKNSDALPVKSYSIKDTFQQLDGKYYSYFQKESLKIYAEREGGTEVTDKFEIAWTEDTVGGAQKPVGFTATLKSNFSEENYPADLDGKNIVIISPAIIDQSYTVEKQTKNLGNEVETTINRNGNHVPNVPTETTEKSNKPNVPVKVVSGSLKVIKHELGDESTKLENAGFTLFKFDDKQGNKRGEQIGDEKMTNNVGEAVWENLAPGQYVLVETTFPTYQTNGGKKRTYLAVDANSQRVITIQAGDNNQTVFVNTEKVANRKPLWYLPGTGGTGTTILWSIGVCCLLTAAILIIRKRRQEEKS